MLIVVPVSRTDENLIDSFAEVFNMQGPYQKHELLVVCRPADIDWAENVYYQIAIKNNKFQKVTLKQFDGDGPRGWPTGPNFYWEQTVLYLKNIKNRKPWLWMELDMTPIKKGWADELYSEYKNCGQPFMGNLQDTTTLTGGGVLLKLCKHLVGAAVYPPSVHKYSEIWKHVSGCNTAWDVLCQWEFAPISHDTKLIQFCFRTQNYKRKSPADKPNETIVVGEDKNAFPDYRFDQPIDFENAVIVHGCNDGSLNELIIKERKGLD